MTGALFGVRVVDLTHVLAGPFCTMILGDLGAEVIKVEPPGGDDSRQYGPFLRDYEGNLHSAYFISINRNKKSICVDLKKPEGKQVLRDLISRSDVVVENYRPGTMARLGFSYEELQRIKQDVIYCAITGFGHDTLPDYAGRPSYDIVAQAYSGLMSITGPEGGPPCRVGASVGDMIAGYQAAISILAALLHRNATGRGQYIDISMIDSLIYTLENAIVRYTVAGEVPGPMGTAHPTIAPFQAFETRDGWLVVPIGNDSLWQQFCAAIGRKELADDPRFRTNSLRCQNRKELSDLLAGIFATRSSREWAEVFAARGIPFSPVNTIDRVVSDPNVNYRKMIVQVEQPRIGNCQIVGTPFKMSETPGTVRCHAPLLGEHTSEVLESLLGYSPRDVLHLREIGAIK